MDEKYGVVIFDGDGTQTEAKFYATLAKAETYGMLNVEEEGRYIAGRVVTVMLAGAVTREIFEPIAQQAGGYLLQWGDSGQMLKGTCVVFNAQHNDFIMNMMLNLGASFRATRS